jgi:hypothetical protein
MRLEADYCWWRNGGLFHSISVEFVWTDREKPQNFGEKRNAVKIQNKYIWNTSPLSVVNLFSVNHYEKKGTSYPYFEISYKTRSF